MRKQLIDYIPKKYRYKVDAFEHDEDGYWVYLKDGYCWEFPGQHTIHEDAISRVLECVREAAACTCPECGTRI